jgi:hypothetical protein
MRVAGSGTASEGCVPDLGAGGERGVCTRPGFQTRAPDQRRDRADRAGEGQHIPEIADEIAPLIQFLQHQGP